jgi:23S rRNA (cytosine1962-C5)-methyltransferase
MRRHPADVRNPEASSGGRLLQPRPLAVDPAKPIPIAEVKVRSRHPLIYAKRVHRVDGHARPGDLVAVYVVGGELLGYALFNPRSEIALRMVRFGPELPDEAFWRERLASAAALRKDALKLEAFTDAYRVIHAEADGFSGLVVDRFGPVLSAEVFTLGMYQRVGEILDPLTKLLGAEHTVVKTGPAVLPQEGFSAPPVPSEALPDSVVVQEFDTKFRVRFEGGHKTGFFCDQRDNRKRLAELCAGRSVLDLCCYTGGFAVQAKRLGEAAEVVAVDLDAEPLKLGKENANLNRVRVQFVQADVFPYMRDLLANNRRFDVVVLDPPKLIRSRAEYDDGVRKHFDLNRLALQLVNPGGLMLTCSCAGLLPEEEFLRLIGSAAYRASPQSAGEEGPPPRGRSIRILSVGGAPADHPVAPNCPETRYLKAVWLFVE